MPSTPQDRDAFIQAAKRTPVNLREWAISMMDQHNRKSYLAPPAPSSIKRDGSRDSVSRTRQPSDDSPRTRATPTSGEIPLNLARDIKRSEASYKSGTAQSPTMGLEQLSLHNNNNHQSHSHSQSQHPTQQQPPQPYPSNTQTQRTARSGYPSPSPLSATAQQFASPRSAPSPYYPHSRNGAPSAGLPFRNGPPKGPLPAPPSPADSSTWRNQQGHRV